MIIIKMTTTTTMMTGLTMIIVVYRHLFDAVDDDDDDDRVLSCMTYKLKKTSSYVSLGGIRLHLSHHVIGVVSALEALLRDVIDDAAIRVLHQVPTGKRKCTLTPILWTTF
jgi:hypothetical protein